MSNDNSWNDLQWSGPAIELSLLRTLLLFRQLRVELPAGIVKILIWMARNHFDYQNIISRDHPGKPLGWQFSVGHFRVGKWKSCEISVV